MLRRAFLGFALLTSSLARADDITALSDEFDKPETLKEWQRVFRVEKSAADQLKRIQIDAKTGRLILEPHAVVWYQDYRGPLVFKQVDGDFVATTQIRAHSRAGDGAPRSQFSLAGLMIRTPRDITPQTWKPGGENYIFLSVGAADRPGEHQLEVKTTLDSKSTLHITPGAPEAELRGVRIGSAFVLLRKLPGEAWRVHQRYSRPDMPKTLQVGITCYTDWQTCSKMPPRQHNQTVIKGGNPDLVAEVDYVRYARPNVPEALAGRNFSDPRAVSDEQIVELFGADGSR